jgi:hypothetical protein
MEIDVLSTGQKERTPDLEPRMLLEDCGSVRGRMVSLVQGLSDAHLAKRGRHPYLGLNTLSEMIRMPRVQEKRHYCDVRPAPGAR